MTGRDRVRSTAVAVTAVTQVLALPVTTLALGPSSNTGTISNANISPVTPAGYAFAIWGLIYAACLALAVYQLLPRQQGRDLHRRTGWWLTAAFVASTVWVPVFGSRVLWLAQLVILMLVGCLAVVAWRSSATAASSTVERWLFRLPVTVYLGWATLASAAGFGTTFRSFGVGASGMVMLGLSLLLVVLATATAVLVVLSVTAVAGFAFTACWALVAVAVGTYADSVRVAAVLAAVVVLVVLVLRSRRSRRPAVVLLG